MSHATFVQQGAAIDYKPVSAVTAGSVVVQGDLVGIAKRDIKAGALGSVSVEGVFDVVKDAATVIAAGAKVYWDAAASQAVTVATANKLLGKAVADAGAGATTVRVRLSQ